MVLLCCIFKPAVVQQLVQKVGFYCGKKKQHYPTASVNTPTGLHIMHLQYTIYL